MDIPKHNRTGASFLLFAFIAAILFGCAGRQMIATTPQGYDSPEAALRASDTLPVNGVLTVTAKIEIIDEGTRYPMKAALLIKAPSFLRLESIPVIGLPDLFVTLNADEMRIFMPSRKCFCTGPATSRNIAEFLHIDIEAEELVPLLLGRSPKITGKGFTASGKMEGSLYRIDQLKNDGIFSIWINPLADKIVRTVFRRNGEDIYEALFENDLVVDGYHLPQQMTINARHAKKVKITYLNARIDSDSRESFTLPCPEGITPSILN
jgi:hypothetical protein